MGKIYDALKRAEKEAQEIRNKDRSSDTEKALIRDEFSNPQAKLHPEITQPKKDNAAITASKERNEQGF